MENRVEKIEAVSFKVGLTYDEAAFILSLLGKVICDNPCSDLYDDLSGHVAEKYTIHSETNSSGAIVWSEDV